MLLLNFYLPNPAEVLSSSSVWYNALWSSFSNFWFATLGISVFIMLITLFLYYLLNK
jgi:hypothetical protein